MNSEIYIEEKLEDIIGFRFRVDKILFSGKSSFQHVDIVQTRGHGKMLLNDGLVMLTERDEFIYHEMMAHVPLFSHPNPENVLIIGGGDGGTAREVLKHDCVKNCVMVEIDKMVVDACIEHIPQTAEVLKGHPKLELIIDDGLKYIKSTKKKFDVVLVDSTDPIGPAAPLFGVEFYQDIYSKLNDGGIVVSQGESPFYHQEMQKKLISILNKVFPISTYYNFTNMSYPGGHWSFSYASKEFDGSKLRRDKDVKQISKSLKYYNKEIHQAAFCLPQYQLENLSPFIKRGE